MLFWRLFIFYFGHLTQAYMYVLLRQSAVTISQKMQKINMTWILTKHQLSVILGSQLWQITAFCIRYQATRWMQSASQNSDFMLHWLILEVWNSDKVLTVFALGALLKQTETQEEVKLRVVNQKPDKTSMAVTLILFWSNLGESAAECFFYTKPFSAPLNTTAMSHTA